MKTMLSLFFLCLTFTAKPLVGAVDAASDAVLDTDGEEVQTGASYYIVSALIGGGGLAVPAPNANGTCSIGVIEERYKRGLSVAFSPAKATDTVIRESTDLNFIFSGVPICEPPVSPVWKVDNYDPSREQWFVTIGGVEGTLTSWFKIEKSERAGAYKLVHCPSVCDSCIILCSDIGLYDEDGVPHLALSHQAIEFQFMKADVKSANKRIFSVI